MQDEACYIFIKISKDSAEVCGKINVFSCTVKHYHHEMIQFFNPSYQTYERPSMNYVLTYSTKKS